MERMETVETVVAKNRSELARRAAKDVSALLAAAVAARGTACFAVSGGSTPALLFDALASRNVAWQDVHVFQVDERIAPTGHPDRNLVQLHDRLLAKIDIPPSNVHAVPVEMGTPGEAARAYAKTIRETCDGVFDVIHLGLGDDGHTASLIPNDPVLTVTRALTATTRRYDGRRRITVSFRTINQARALVWLVTGASKVDAVRLLLAQDPTVPAGRVRASGANTLYLDHDANGSATTIDRT